MFQNSGRRACRRILQKQRRPAFRPRRLGRVPEPAIEHQRLSHLHREVPTGTPGIECQRRSANCFIIEKIQRRREFLRRNTPPVRALNGTEKRIRTDIA